MGGRLPRVALLRPRKLGPALREPVACVFNRSAVINCRRARRLAGASQLTDAMLSRVAGEHAIGPPPRAINTHPSVQKADFIRIPTRQ